MKLQQALYGLVAIAVVVGLGITAVSAGYNEIPAQNESFSETLTIDVENGSTVDQTAERYYDNETITSDSQNLNEGDDYEFDGDTGNIAWNNSSQKVTDGAEAQIDYTARVKPAQARTVMDLTSGTLTVSTFSILPAALVLLLLAVAGRWA
ncbi:hypothetical protein [Halomarina rubra]|uniref:DUF3592 domain-containing protein n=1 Tax=Halomarina rubra TaxID=2071873 RepID=A0ABD6B106_9EURY|nr:hypothetical protein [Halomarina rubra]